MKKRSRRFLTVSFLALIALVGLISTTFKVCAAIRHYQSTLRLAKAVRDNNPTHVRVELAAGADPNVPLHPRPLSLHTVVQLVLHTKHPKEPGETLVLHATESDDDQILQSLLEAGGNVQDRDDEGRTALCHAVLEKRHRKIRLLVQHGADVNDSHLLNMLLVAGMFFEVNSDDVNYLLAHGADPNDQVTIAGSTSTPLTSATLLGYNEVIRDLLKAGANVNMSAMLKATPLTLAAISGKTEAVQILLGAGADTTLRDQRGKTAEEEAAGIGEKHIAQIIHNYHASHSSP